MKKYISITGVVVLVLFFDQWLKIWVKTHYRYGMETPIFGQSWAKIGLVENIGMAFGWGLGADWGKLALSLFRVAAIIFLVVYLRRMIRAGTPTGLLTCMALILAGAAGNLIDSIFYGKIFSASEPYSQGPAILFPRWGGYGGWLHGKVVDMLHFTATFPDRLPYIGGKEIFPYVFNISDASICIGVTCALLFYRGQFENVKKTEIFTGEIQGQESL